MLRLLQHSLRQFASSSGGQFATELGGQFLRNTHHANRHLKNIKESLESRYCINILISLFYTATRTFSKKYLDQLRQTGALTDHHPKSNPRSGGTDLFDNFFEDEEEMEGDEIEEDLPDAS